MTPTARGVDKENTMTDQRIPLIIEEVTDPVEVAHAQALGDTVIGARISCKS